MDKLQNSACGGFVTAEYVTAMAQGKSLSEALPGPTAIGPWGQGASTCGDAFSRPRRRTVSRKASVEDFSARYIDAIALC